jgi:flavin reductase (DIM6/NTAB) family NADH-FMN oxidoreductase RutF
MTRIAIDPMEALPEMISRLKKPGLLLTCGSEGNPITIGWCTIGIIWNRPVISVLVRPSRYSFELLRNNGDFAVCVPPGDDRKIAAAVAWCGTHSGRDGDKYRGTGLTREPGIFIDTPYVAECPVHFECRSIHRGDVIEGALAPGITGEHYPDGDFHRIWWGEILGAWRAGPGASTPPGSDQRPQRAFRQ